MQLDKHNKVKFIDIERMRMGLNDFKKDLVNQNVDENGITNSVSKMFLVILGFLKLTNLYNMRFCDTNIKLIVITQLKATNNLNNNNIMVQENMIIGQNLYAFL